MQNDEYGYRRNDEYTDDNADPGEDRDAQSSGGEWDRASQAGERQGGSANRKSGSGSSSSARTRSNSGTQGGSRTKRDSGKRKGKKERIDLKEAPSARPIHRIMPCVCFAFALFLFICMFLNLVSGTRAQSAETHPIGAVGYGLCYAFFGLFGGSGFLFPILLGYAAVNWRRAVDAHRLTERLVTSFLLQLLLSIFVHSCCLGALEPAERYMTASELFQTGAKMQGGGLFGGGIGYFLCSRMNVFGAILLTVLLLLTALFFFIGMTPQHLFARIRAKIVISRAMRKKEDTDEVDQVNIMDRMERKHERAQGKRSESDEDETPAPPPGAVTYPNGRSGARSLLRRESPLLAGEDSPVPVMPITDASDEVSEDSPLFVPDELGDKLGEKTERRETRSPEGNAESATKKEGTAAPTVRTQVRPAPTRQDPQTLARRKAESAAVDQIFPPQPSEKLNAARRVQKSDQGFELGSIFLAGPDAEIPKERVHVPLPPEVPLPGSGGGHAETEAPAVQARTPANSAVRPAVGTVRIDEQSAAQPPRRNDGSAARPAPTAPASAVRQPTLRQAASKGVRDFGMTNEELDAKESAALTIDRVLAAKKRAARPDHTPVKAEPKPIPHADRAYTFPPITYLQAGEAITEQTKEELEQNARKIAEKLETFHVETKEITYSCGPTVTRYEVFPAPNVRVRTILNMDKDIALTFGAKDVRMDSMEGKSAIGIEVPNRNRSTVYLRNMIEAKEFAENKNPLFCCLGSDVAGTPVYFSIPKMPHLLVAGATNSGKSVCINCIVMSILYKLRPDQVRLVMIDPKKVEFVPYQGIPHLLAPIITTPKDASGALQAAVNEMESRFDRMSEVGVRNLEAYNKLAATDAGLAPMPMIVIIIDELADLMMVAKNEVEDSICRLLQKARAAGIYLIIGTQRPSVDVITGLLKANIPSRIACTVASVVDSRTVLDRGGAEKLLGRGDMLFSPTGSHSPIRVQGAFLSDSEVEKVCEFVRVTNGTAQYDENFTKLMKEYSAQAGKKGKEESEPADLGDGDPREDSKYMDAVRVAVEMGKISTSMLQRKIGVGYARGAKLLDRMESEGIVTKQDGAKPRDVLMSPEQFLARFMENGDASDEEE